MSRESSEQHVLARGGGGACEALVRSGPDQVARTNRSFRVSCLYTHEGVAITNGTVTGNTLHATWTETENLHADPAFDAGSIWFTLAADGNSFTGNWNYSSDAEGSSRGALNGTRIP